ncbi:MAG: serine/threonine-protein phosphatase [Leptospiraceae bacterium]|nr:serine/threonine-protein phosphatase [Leptospiraceae bacterium]
MNTIIYLFNFFILVIFYRVIYLSYFQGSSNIDLVVVSFSTGSILIMLQSFRLRKFSAIFVGAVSLIFYLTTITVFSKIDNLSINTEALLIPIFFFVPSTLIASFIILSSIKVVQKSNLLSFHKDTIDHDLSLAKKVQDSLFPETNKINGIEFRVFRENQQAIGGDFFDFVQLREGNLGVFLTDVAGHGVSSAMIAAILKVLVSNMPYRLKLNPSGFLDYLDAKLYSDFGTHHASAIYIFFDFIRKQIHYGNAGHPHPFYSENGEEFKEIKTEGAILGYKIKSPIAVSISFPLIQGSRFFLFTDGLLETANTEGETLEINTLIQFLNEYREVKEISKFKDLVTKKIDSFFQGASFSDDTMYLILELT